MYWSQTFILFYNNNNIVIVIIIIIIIIIVCVSVTDFIASVLTHNIYIYIYSI